MEAFNLDSGATQPQLCFTAAAVIIPTLKSNGNLMERKETFCGSYTTTEIGISFDLFLELWDTEMVVSLQFTVNEKIVQRCLR